MNQNKNHIGEHLLLQYLLGNLDEAERCRIEAWLNESKENRKVFDRLENLWLETGKLSPPPVAVDTMAAWKKISGRIDQAEKEKREVVPGQIISLPLLKWISGIAALIVILLGAWWIFNYLNRPGMIDLRAENSIVRDTLPDGSIVALNVNTTLQYPDRFSKNIREVHLSGEAFFKVSPDRNHPFIIDAGIAKIKVVGTTFNVKTLPGAPVYVTVSEGIVLLFRVDEKSGDTVSQLINAGQQGVVSLREPKPHLETREDPVSLFWLDRSMVFHDAPLSQVLEAVAKCYHVTVKTSTPAILDCRLTTTFSDEPVELILKIIAESFNLQIKQENQTYLLIGNGCSK